VRRLISHVMGHIACLNGTGIDKPQSAEIRSSCSLKKNNSMNVIFMLEVGMATGQHFQDLCLPAVFFFKEKQCLEMSLYSRSKPHT
jgi:hypothetical protein